MSTINNIRKIAATFLLLVFMLGATPKSFLHDAITSHQHQQKIVYKCSHHHVNISAQGFNCQVDNLVIEMPFLHVIEPSFVFVTKHYIHYYERLSNTFQLSQKAVTSLRGPPVC